MGNKILKEQGYSEEVTTAIMGHADYTGVPRESQLAKALFAFDELTGFIFAVTYVRPSKAVKESRWFSMPCRQNRPWSRRVLGKWK